MNLNTEKSGLREGSTQFQADNFRRQTTYMHLSIYSSLLHQMVRKRYHMRRDQDYSSISSISLAFDGHACVQFFAALATALLITQGPNMEEGTRVCRTKDYKLLIDVA